MGKQFFLIIALVLTIGFQSYADVAFSLQYRGGAKHSSLANHCYYEELKLDVPFNQVLKPTNHENYCVEVECGEDYLLKIKHCPRSSMSCSTGPNDVSKTFPDCCGKQIC